MLEVRNLRVSVEGKEIVGGVDLTIQAGEVHALMGPNGSGKSTLAAALAGHPNYQITGGKVILNGQDLLALTPEERSRQGLFLAWQYPVAIPGLSVSEFLLSAVNAHRTAAQETTLSPVDFNHQLQAVASQLKLSPDFLTRSINDGFSGGEKKRLEILQLAILKPKLAILDETDSGLDIDALKLVAEGVNQLVGPQLAVLVITHYQRLLHYLKPTHVHVMVGGRLVESAGPELVEKVEQSGYQQFAAAAA